jgi:hypothetical protein
MSEPILNQWFLAKPMEFVFVDRKTRRPGLKAIEWTSPEAVDAGGFY